MFLSQVGFYWYPSKVCQGPFLTAKRIADMGDKGVRDRRRRSIVRYSLWVGTLLVALLFAIDGIVLLSLNLARVQSDLLAASTLPRAVAAQRLTVDASHLTALTAELPAAASVAERQTVMQRIDGLRMALANDRDLLRKAGLSADDDSALMRTEAALLDGADAMNGVAQSGIDLREELTRQRDRARQACDSKGRTRECQDVLWALAGSGEMGGEIRDDEPGLKAVAVLQRDLGINEQRRINLLRRQSELAARFLAMASAQSESAGEELGLQQRMVVRWIERIEWAMGVALAAALGMLLRLRYVARRRARQKNSPAVETAGE